MYVLDTRARVIHKTIRIQMIHKRSVCSSRPSKHFRVKRAFLPQQRTTSLNEMYRTHSLYTLHVVIRQTGIIFFTFFCPFQYLYEKTLRRTKEAFLMRNTKRKDSILRKKQNVTDIPFERLFRSVFGTEQFNALYDSQRSCTLYVSSLSAIKGVKLV